MAGVRDHTELNVWKLCDQLRVVVRPILDRPRLQADRTLWSQIDRAVERPCPNIAEGFSRYFPRDFARFTQIAKASLSELVDHMETAEAKGITSAEETAAIVTLAKRARGAATRLIQYLETAKTPRQHDGRKRRDK